MTNSKNKDKSFGIRRFAKAEKSLFFKNDSCLSNCQKVFSRNPETTTNHFFKEVSFFFGEQECAAQGVWFCERGSS